MSRAKDILNAIRIGLRQGVIRSPDIEFLYSDGPKRVTMLRLVEEAIAELGEQGSAPACDRCQDTGWWTPPNGNPEPCCEKPATGAPQAPRCQKCGTHEVSRQQTCHNSACEAYAQDVTIYEGWKPARGVLACGKPVTGEQR